jgi:hypothetical protein
MFNKKCLIGMAVKWQHLNLNRFNNISQPAAKMFYDGLSTLRIQEWRAIVQITK